MDADVVLGPVERRGERHGAGICIWRKENSASDWDRYPAMTSAAGQSSWSVISTCLPKISCSSAARPAASMDQVSRRSRGVSPVSSQVMTRRTQASWVILVISASTLAGGGGSCRGPRWRPAHRAAGWPWPGWCRRSRGPDAGAVRGNGRDRPAPGAVDVAAGVAGGQAAEPVLIDDGTGGGGQGEQVAAVAGGHRARVVRVHAGQRREVGSEFCPASKTTVISVPSCLAAAARAACRAASVL